MSFFKKMKYFFSFLLLFLLTFVFINFYRSIKSSAGNERKKNVILIVIDSLRRDHISFFGYERKTSPFLDSLFNEGILFCNAFSASSQTIPSVASMLTGIYPYRHGSHFFSYNQSYHPIKKVEEGAQPLLRGENILISEILKKNGYITIAINSNPGIRETFGFSQGFDYFKYLDCFAEKNIGFCNGLDINRIFKNEVLPLIKNKNYFIYLHYMDVHYPYYKPHSFKGRFREFKGSPFFINGKINSLHQEEIEVDYLKACYDEGILYQDEVIADLFRILKEGELLSNALILIVSDHGDEFFEHGGLGHGTTCYNELLESFIFLFNPALSKRFVNMPVSLVDVFPTILDWTKIDKPKKIDGISLFSQIVNGSKSLFKNKRRIIKSELGDIKAIIDGNLKFICDLKNKTSELYDIGSDYREQKNIIFFRQGEANMYEKEIERMAKKMLVSYVSKSLNEREKEILRSFGYIR